MATGTLTSTTIAARYKSLLKITGTANDVFHATTLKVIEDGDGNNSCLQLAQNRAEIVPVANHANAFEVSQADGTQIFNIDSSTPALQINYDVTLPQGKKIIFDSTDTWIGANTDNPEDLVIEADEDIILLPDRNVGIGISTPGAKLTVQEDSTSNEIFKITDTGTNPEANCYIIPFEMPSTDENQRCDVQVGGPGRYILFAMSNNGGRYAGFVYVASGTNNATATTIGTAAYITVGSDGSGANKIRITNTYAGTALISGVILALDSYGTLTVGSVS